MIDIIPDNLDLYETYEREQERLERIHRKQDNEEEIIKEDA